MFECVSKKILFALLLLMLVGCEIKRPEDVIPPDKLEALLYDYHLAQVMGTDLSGSSYKRKLYSEYVFEKHGYTEAQFDSSMLWYTRKPRYLYDVYASLHERLSNEIEAMDDATEKDRKNDLLALDGDTVNLWQGAKTEFLSATTMKNRLLFTCAVDTIFLPGDSVAMSMNVEFITNGNENVKQSAHLAMLLEYNDSSFVSRGFSFSNSGHHAIGFERDFERTIKEIRAFLYYTDNDTLYRSRMLVGDIEVMRIHPMDDESEE